MSVVPDSVTGMTDAQDRPAPGRSTTTYFVAQSIDGFVADRDDGLEWLLQFGFAPFQARYDEFFANVGAVVMGASTYRWLAGSGEPWPYPGLPSWVLTHHDLPPLDGAEGVRVGTDAGEVAALARSAAGGRIVWIVGGGRTAAQFAEAGELDELLVTVMPITLGEGARVLPHAGPARRWLPTGTTPFEGGAIELAYRAVASSAEGDQRARSS